MERTGLDTYKSLELHAKQAKAWPEWRTRALDEIRGRIARGKAPVPGTYQSAGADHSLLVEIFRHEADPEAAWREACAGGCSDRLWLELADGRAVKHPAEAAPIYLRLAESAVARVRDGRYEHAVALLVKAASAMRRIGAAPGFIQRLDALRGKYKIKRNFIKLLEEKRKALYSS